VGRRSTRRLDRLVRPERALGLGSGPRRRGGRHGRHRGRRHRRRRPDREHDPVKGRRGRGQAARQGAFRGRRRACWS
jgi:hypothetical protein